MGIKSILLATTALVLSTSANSATVTYGFLTTDDTTDYITDTNTLRIYKRFDTFNLSYADTIAAVSAGGIYEGWSIATSDVADDFYSAALGLASNPCTGATANGTICGVIAGWVPDDFGDSGQIASYSSDENFWYLSTNDTPGQSQVETGLGYISRNGYIVDYGDYGTPDSVDYNGITRPDIAHVNALLYKGGAVVPVPAAVWLFGSGLIGLIGIARRKKS